MPRFVPHFFQRWLPPVAVPVVLLLAWFVAPLVGGGKTLFLRDVLQTHLADRIGLATSLRQLELPLIPLVDPLRAGGQALAGNLNALPFYPDNLLLLLAWPGAAGAAGRAALWALNAHFWLHWFLALGAALWMGRAFGLSRPAAWMGATVYAFSGYFASQLNLYNTVAAAALAPALVAAVLETAPGKAPAVRRRGLVGAALLWALLVLGGEPLLALLALALAISAGVLFAGRRALSGRLMLALLAGTLLAAPQIVEALRILPISFRNNAAFGEPQAILGSFRWAHLADFVWPFFFGRPNLSEVFAPHQFDGYPPLLFTLYPGLLALALAATGLARRGRATIWGAGAIVVALFFALGRFNPVVEATLGPALGPAVAIPRQVLAARGRRREPARRHRIRGGLGAGTRGRAISADPRTLAAAVCRRVCGLSRRGESRPRYGESPRRRTALADPASGDARRAVGANAGPRRAVARPPGARLGPPAPRAKRFAAGATQRWPLSSDCTPRPSSGRSCRRCRWTMPRSTSPRRRSWRRSRRAASWCTARISTSSGRAR